MPVAGRPVDQRVQSFTLSLRSPVPNRFAPALCASLQLCVRAHTSVMISVHFGSMPAILAGGDVEAAFDKAVPRSCNPWVEGGFMHRLSCA